LPNYGDIFGSSSSSPYAPQPVVADFSQFWSNKVNKIKYNIF
jgi:hypothetical protein